MSEEKITTAEYCAIEFLGKIYHVTLTKVSQTSDMKSPR